MNHPFVVSLDFFGSFTARFIGDLWGKNQIPGKMAQQSKPEPQPNSNLSGHTEKQTHLSGYSQRALLKKNAGFL